MKDSSARAEKASREKTVKVIFYLVHIRRFPLAQWATLVVLDLT